MSTPPNLNDPEMQEIFEGFLVETKELLDTLSQDLMDLENAPEDLDLMNKIFRSIHTIKGTSSFMGFEQIKEITHKGENLLNKLRKQELEVNPSIIDALFEVNDWVEKLLEALQSGEDKELDYGDTLQKLEELQNPEDAETEKPEESDKEEKEEKPEEIKTEEQKEEAKTEEETETKKEGKDSAVDSVLHDEEITKGKDDFTDEQKEMLDAAFAEINQGFASEKKEKPETEKSEKKTEDHKKKEEKPKTTKPKSKKDEGKNGKPTGSKKPQITTETLRIDVNRIETLMDLSGELVLGRNRLAQMSETMAKELDGDSVRDLSETTASIDFVTSEIQTAVMRMRMVPIGKLYKKAPRIVRDLSREFGKKIKLVVKGEETEIDRSIIEELNDPLVHMIRNSCDHGIEPPEERKEIGKPEQGTITLDADQEGNNIVLKISDDGRGMDPEKLKDKAIEKGAITEEQIGQMTERDILQLIFHPGFSTSKKVTSVSGRGVGMDVVKSNIQNLKGMVDIESELGIGSTFTIKLPLTLAIIQGLLVQMHDETYAIPLSSVEEVVAVNLDKISTVNAQEVIRIREDVLPLVRLDEKLDSPVKKNDLEERYVVVVGAGVNKAGFVVDELLGQQEIVIKSIGEYLGQIQGIAGSTILGDGRVIMIIDVAELVHQANVNAY